MTLAGEMDGLGDLIEAAAVVPNVWRWPVEAVTVPCAIVGYPEGAQDLQETFRSESGETLYPVWILVGKTSTKDARDALSAQLSGAGGLKQALDGTHAFGDVLVKTAEFSEVTVEGIRYIGVKYIVGVLS